MFIEIGENPNRSPIGANYVLIVLKSIIGLGDAGRACENDDILMINDYWRLVIKSCETRVKIFAQHLSLIT